MDILIVDDEKDIRDLVSGILSDEGYETRTAKDGISALEQIQARQPHLVILDVWLGDSERDGLKILDQIKRDHPYVPVIMISGHATIETAVSAIKKGAYDFIEKPFQAEKLLILVERATELSRLKQENAELNKKYIGKNLNLIGSSTSSNKLRQDIEKAAGNTWRLFLSGPQGTMKDLLAQEIHKKSQRKDQPFVVVNCAQIHPSQLDAELFGLETTEGTRRIGLLEKAHQGTLFLDEITSLPLPTQGKITKVLIEESFTRLGSTDKISVNIRFMAGSSENILSLIQAGDFREDLFYRLNVMNIQIPSLTARSSDFSDIVRAICEQHAEYQGAKVRPFTDDTVAFLQSYQWPKNFIELKNVVERVLIDAPGTGPITIDMLPSNLFQKNMNTLTTTSEIVVLPIKEAREIFEKEYLQAQVNRFSGNITQTAKFIGMERSALHRKLKTLNLHDVKIDG